MESSVALTLDCEDMFKEITKKLYGEEAGAGAGGAGEGVEFPACERDGDGDGDDEELRPEEQLTAWGLAALMQGGFPPPGILAPNFTPRTDPTAEDRWSHAEEPLAWAHSRVAAYNPAQRLFKCAECECVGFLARVAEHWLGAHSTARAFACPLGGCAFAAPWARLVRRHLARDHRRDPAAADASLRDNPALLDLTRYLQRLKARVDARRAAPAAPAPAPPAAPAAPTAPTDPKRYACAACPYATDRRDLFTRHEHIHRDDKPFHCYLCRKLFNRADHVKKHFLRMHRDHPYDLNRIRRSGDKPSPPPPPALVALSSPAATLYYPKPEPALEYAAPPPPQPAAIKLERAPPPPPMKPERAAPSAGGGVGAAGRRRGERRYACMYCTWSGADNWCLKRHLNTHLKPFGCSLCEYKAARAERLATHVAKVHNKRACAKCAFLADDTDQLQQHLREAHHIESRNLRVPASGGRGAAGPAYPGPAAGGGAAEGAEGRRRAGAARLFGYLEASDGSGDEFDAPLEFAATAPAAVPPPPLFARDKENAAPASAPTAPTAEHHLLHDHCLRY